MRGDEETGITVYTIGFQLGGSQEAIETLSGCASRPGQFYNADNGLQLRQAFATSPCRSRSSI